MSDCDRGADYQNWCFSFSFKMAELQFRVWWEFVPSAQNVADLPCRGKEVDEDGLLNALGSVLSEFLDSVIYRAGNQSWVYNSIPVSSTSQFLPHEPSTQSPLGIRSTNLNSNRLYLGILSPDWKFKQGMQ